jgi:hypothetical protein
VNSSNYTFTFNIDYKSQADAQTSCQAQGAHLAVYVSEAEQAEVGVGRGMYTGAAVVPLLLDCCGLGGMTEHSSVV